MEDSEKVINVTKDVIKDWTKEEKYYLLNALKSYGASDIDKIRDYISTRTHEETRLAIEYFKSIAMKHPIFEKKRQMNIAKNNQKPRVPLTMWAKKISDNLSFSEMHTETANAVRLIAELEDIPSPACTDSINFRQVYHQIANAMEGKPVQPDLVTSAVLNKCIIETALTSKAFIKTSIFKYVISTFDLSEREINMFPRPTDDQELSILRHLSSQRCYNPFSVQEEYLTPAESILHSKLLKKD